MNSGIALMMQSAAPPPSPIKAGVDGGVGAGDLGQSGGKPKSK